MCRPKGFPKSSFAPRWFYQRRLGRVDRLRSSSGDCVFWTHTRTPAARPDYTCFRSMRRARCRRQVRRKSSLLGNTLHTLMWVVLPSRGPSGVRCLANFKHRRTSADGTGFYDVNALAFDFATPWHVAKKLVSAARSTAIRFLNQGCGAEVTVRRATSSWQAAPASGFEVVRV